MSSVSLPSGTVNSQLRHWSLTDPSTPAFIFRSADPNNPRLTLTRREVFTFASRYAAILRRKGIQHGDIVCNVLPNSPERLLTDFGIMMAGAAVMNGRAFLADGSAFLRSFQQSGCVAVVVDPKQPPNPVTTLQGKVLFKNNDFIECPEAPALKQLLKVDCGLGRNGRKPFLEDLEEEKEEYTADVQPADNAYILTTSGSSGYSKLVPRSHAVFLAFGESDVTRTGIQKGDIFFNDRSLGWITGAPIYYCQKGVTRVLIDFSTSTPVDPLALMWQSIKEEGCTTAVLVPQHIDMSLIRPELWTHINPKLRSILTGGQPVKKQLREVVGQMADSLITGYASTETGIITMLHVNQGNKDTFRDGDNGLPIAACQAKIVDDNLEEISEADKVGEVLVRSWTMFSGYLGIKHADQQDIFTQDGWFRTQDVGFRDDRGHLYVFCRKSNAIIHGPTTVYPGSLEMKMEQCPRVQNVIIVPVPDPILYQEQCACVLPEPGAKVTAEDVHKFCQSLFLAPGTSELSAVPKYYLLFDSFPATSTGKTDRRAIRATALKRLGRADPVLSVSTD